MVNWGTLLFTWAFSAGIGVVGFVVAGLVTWVIFPTDSGLIFRAGIAGWGILTTILGVFFTILSGLD